MAEREPKAARATKLDKVRVQRYALHGILLHKPIKVHSFQRKKFKLLHLN